MALVESLFKGWRGMLVGFGAGIAAPTLFPDAGSKARPVAKTVVKGVLAVADGLRTAVAEATEQVNDLVAEVRAERAANGNDGGAGERARSAGR
ncbi:MAG: DUF5132 domain-containing protein [Deltaproteobacteria bacterium]|nr:MAG: DUF5132 domain-containing protein [Deltaproteobacteria bacterium]